MSKHTSPKMKLDKRIILLVSFSVISFLAYTNFLKKKALCFGDSITYGALVEGSGWVELLNKKTDEIIALNIGRKGRKTSDKEELTPYLLKNKDANFVLLFLGVNDLKNGNDSLVNLCIQNMKWMILKTKEIIPNTKIVIIAPCSINLESMSELNKSKLYNKSTKKSLISLEKAYRKLADDNSVDFISLLNVVSKNNYEDGLHPNIEGHKEIADRIWSYLKNN